ncbi:MAG: hypothetical protein IH936_11825 [Acidobacteria bacterium]|nr:hypothetical protein [Acidobacteriota bacterium]
MTRWSVRYPVFALALCLLASLLPVGCAESKTEDGAAGGVVPEDAGGGPKVGTALEEPEPTAFGAGSAMRHAPTAVDLTYKGKDDACAQEWAGDVCVQTIPPKGTIWKGPGNSGKPQKVRWWIDDAQRGEYWWEIEYKGEDSDENWLGTVDPIECNDNHTTSIKPDPDDLDPEELTWLYRITVYECTEDDTKGDCLCKTDPRIEIHP